MGYSKGQPAHQCDAVSRDHDNRNNSIKRSGILFSPGQTLGDAGGNINWESCRVMMAADATKIEKARCFNKEFLQSTFCLTGT